MKSLCRGWITLLVCGLVLILAACSTEEEDFIQGRWGNGDVHYWAEWIFSNGDYYYGYSYTIQATSYETGHYRVKETGEDFILLEMYGQEGNMTPIDEPVEYRIEFDVEEDMISIRGNHYYRVSSSSLDALATSRAP